MKKIILIFLLNCTLTYAQKDNYFGFKTGLNLSHILGVEFGGYKKIGFNSGIFSQIRLSKNWRGQFEISYTGKGGSYNWTNENNYVKRYFIQLYYIEFSLLLQYNYKKIFFEFGPSLGYLNQAKEYSPNRSLYDIENHFSTMEKSFNIGIKYFFNEKWGINFRYNNSIIPIRIIPSEQFNSVFNFSLSFQIAFQKKRKNKR